jgi:hypothetical protein
MCLTSSLNHRVQPGKEVFLEVDPVAAEESEGDAAIRATVDLPQSVFRLRVDDDGEGTAELFGHLAEDLGALSRGGIRS